MNVFIKSCVESNNDIEMGEDIFKSLCFQGGITVTTAMLRDAGQLQGPIIVNPFKATTGSLSTHEIQFTDKTAEIFH